ncbi:MAG TPA: hypothetical protein ACFYD7_06945 [Candidatus Wujingus californicus]|uniref:hypothetical protein n=1 Tax=Candidatus Wujingus californicus TaxID=3367618 RepID=UPI001E0E2799|nr:hypothetical protein [Planctomycetota bacterium]MDO8131052.1 hypothetical protein [Candidatus Brocadiales bacterium]
MNQSVIVVDYLGVFSLIPIIFRFRSIRSIFFLHKNRDIINRLAIKMLSSLGWSFEPIDFTMSPSGALSPFKELEKLLIDKIKICRESVFPRQVNKLANISNYERKRLLAYFGKYAGAEMYFAMQLYIYLTTKSPWKEKVKVVLLRKNLFSDIISDTYKSDNLKLHYYLSLFRGKLILREGYLFDELILDMTRFHIRKIVITLIFVCRSLFYKCNFFFQAPKSCVKKHKICAFVFNTSATDVSNCLPWGITQINNLKNETLCLHLPTMPETRRDFYRERSDRFIQYSFNPVAENKDIEIKSAWSSFLIIFLKNVYIYRKLFGLVSIKLWMSKYLIDLILYTSFFEALFRTNGTKILWSMNEDGTQTQMAAIAIHRVGGVSLGTTWSQVLFPVWRIQHNQHDIYFMWGKRLANVRMHIYDQVDSFVIVGYPADSAFYSEFEKAQELRSMIYNKYSGKNILVYFDNTSANDDLISLEKLIGMYTEMFAWLREDHANFIVIKAKRLDILDKYPPIKAMIDEFCKERRMLVLFDKGAIYPGLAADVALGASLSLTTLAAVLGRPFLFYDIHNVAKDYPLVLPNTFIINDVDDIRETINNIIKENAVRGYPEKLRPIKGSDIDPFVDGKAAYRMREYIKNLLYKFDKGCINYKAINFANEEHKKRWGEDTVITGSLRICNWE